MPFRLQNVLVWGLVITASAGVDLGGFSGEATASAQQMSAEQIELTLSVEAETGEAVVAHLIEPGGEQRALPLPEVSDGLYSIIVEARKINYIVVFEVLGEGVTSQSQPLLLTDLGVVPAVLGILSSMPASQPAETNSWGWVGLGFGALSLLALAIWALPGREIKIAKTQPDNTP